MRKPWRETIQLPAPLMEVSIRRVMTREEAEAAAVEERVRSAYERGRVEGERALSEMLVQQRQETQQIVEGVVASLQAAVSQVVKETEQALVGLALEIAKKVVGSLSLTPAMIEGVVQEALGQVDASAEIQVSLHPLDMELLRASNSAMLQNAGESRQTTFQGSAEVSRGGCIVRTRFGTVDALRESKFEQLEKELLT